MYEPSACLLTLVFWIAPVYVDGFNCYSGFDPLPDFTFLSTANPFNKLQMDSSSASAPSLQKAVFCGRSDGNKE